MTIDLDEYSYDEWIRFVFDHPVAKQGQKAWYWNDQWEYEADSKRILQNSIHLFTDPAFLISRYSPEQIDQGFWFLLGEGQLDDCIWNDEIEVQLRMDCVLAMANVFRLLFAKHPIQHVCFMWWDLLRNLTENPDSRIEQAMLDALSEIIMLDSRDCQHAALHGLAHLRHPGKKSVFERYLATHCELDSDLRTYALAASKGEVQ